MKKTILFISSVLAMLFSCFFAFAGDLDSDANFTEKEVTSAAEPLSLGVGIDFFDFSVDLFGLFKDDVDPSPSIGLSPFLNFKKQNITLYPTFAYRNSKYIVYRDYDDVYYRAINSTNFGFYAKYDAKKYKIGFGFETIYTIPRADVVKDSDKEYEYKLSFLVQHNKREGDWYLSNGRSAYFSVTFFVAGALCLTSSYSNTVSLFTSSKKNPIRSWRFVNCFNLSLKTMLGNNVSDYTISRYSLSSMFLSYPGVCDIERLSVYAREQIVILSPYFCKNFFLWYSSIFTELGVGLFGDVNTSDYTKSQLRTSSSFETGIRIEKFCNIFVRFSYLFPKAPSINASFLFNFNLG